MERSPRANGYLSLEPGLKTFTHDAGVLTWIGDGRSAFAVGGLHAPTRPVDLLTAFRRHVEREGYARALLFPVSEAERDDVARAGFRTLMVGAEAFVDPARFTLEGGNRADLRQMVNRGRGRFGLEVEEVVLPDEPEKSETIESVYARWLSARPVSHRLELLVGTPNVEEPFARRYFVARDQGNVEVALTLTPGWGGEGWGVDVMARTPQAPPGAMEVALVGVIEALAAEGVRRLSLGACPMLEAVPPEPDDPRALRGVLRWIYRSTITQRLFHFRGLARFKAKFDPEWAPSYIAAWPQVGVRALYTGCRMWGLFGPRSLTPRRPDDVDQIGLSSVGRTS